MATFPRTRNSRSVSPLKRKSKAETNPISLQSANAEMFQEMEEPSPTGSSNAISPVAERLAGYVSPLRARTMKEYDQQICDLKKENFHLKLRMYFLEEKMDKKFEGNILDLHKINLQLQVDTEALHKELEQKNSLLEEALGTLEKLENNHKQEIHTIKTKMSNERSALEKKINILQKRLSNNCKLDLEDTSSELGLRSSATESDIARLQLQEQKQNEVHLQAELHSQTIVSQNLFKTIEHKEQEIQKLKEQLELKSGAIETINSAVHTAVYKATMAARKGDKIGITAAREELKTVLRKILLQYNDEYFEGKEASSRPDHSENLQYLQEELIIKEETIKLQKEELDKVTEKLHLLQASVQSDLAKESKLHDEAIVEKDTLINRLQASLKDGERRIENLLKEQNEIITISKKSLQTLQSSLKDRDSAMHDLQRSTKKSIEHKNLEIEKLQSEIHIKERDLALAKHNIDALNTDINTNKQECESVKRDLDSYRNKLVRLTEETKTLTENLGVATEELNKLRKNKETELENLTEELKVTRKELQIKECNINEMEKTIKYKDEELCNIEEDYGRLQDKVEKLQNFLLEKEEEVFTSFQIIDEMRRIIQGSISKEKFQETTDFRWQQDLDQANILKHLKLKLGNLLNKNYSNISTEYSKQLEDSVASLLQHVCEASCKFPETSDKLENIQCFLSNIQPSDSLIHECSEGKSLNKTEHSSLCSHNSKLNRLSENCHTCELMDHKISEKNNGDNANLPVALQCEYRGTAQKTKSINDCGDLAMPTQYQANIEPTTYSYYDKINNITFSPVKDIPHSYSDVALKNCYTPQHERSVQSLPAELEMHCEEWSSENLPPPIILQLPDVSCPVSSSKIHGDYSTKFKELWLQSLSQFGHSNDIQELKEEIYILVLKLRQLWEQSSDIIGKGNSQNKQCIMHAKELCILQQQLSESEELTSNLQRHMTEMAVFLKQLLEVEATTEIGSKHQRESEISFNDMNDQQSPESQYIPYIHSKEFNDGIGSQVIGQEQERVDLLSHSEECYFDTDPCDIKNISNFHETVVHNSIQSDNQNHTQYSNMVECSNRKWWSTSPLHIPHDEWINNEITKIQGDKCSRTDQVVVLEASDSDDILLLLNDRGLPKDVFLRNNLHQSCSNPTCCPASNTSLGSMKLDTIDAPVPFSKLNDPISNALKSNKQIMNATHEFANSRTQVQSNTNAGLAHWSSDSDIWSEPDREISLQRIGVDLNIMHSLSGEPIGPVLETKSSHKSYIMQQTLNKIDSSGESFLGTNKTSPSSLSKSHPASKWKQKLEIYLNKLEGLTTTLSLELQHHHDLSEEVITQLTMLPAGEQDVTSSSGLPSVIQDYSHTTTLLWKRISELIAENKELQDILQKTVSVRVGDRRKRTSNSDSSRKNTLRKSKHKSQPATKSEQESRLSEYQNKLKKLELLLDKKNKECERLMKANEILEAKSSYSCPLRRHKPMEDSLSNTEWDSEEVRKLKHEIDKQEQWEQKIESLVLEMKVDSEKKDILWQESKKKLNEYKDANECLETMCKDKDHELECTYDTVRSLREEIYEKGEEIVKLQSLINELRNDVEQCRKHSVGLEEQNTSQQQELDKAKEEMQELEKKCLEFQQSLQESNGAKAESLEKNTYLKGKLAAVEQELEQLKTEKQILVMQNEIIAKTKKDNIQQEITMLENEIKSLRTQLNHVSIMQMEQKIHCDSCTHPGSRKSSAEMIKLPESIKRSMFSKELGFYQHSNWEGDILLVNLISEMRHLRNKLSSSLKLHRQLKKQTRNCSPENEKDEENKYYVRDTDCEPSSLLSDASFDRSSNGTLIRSTDGSTSGASMESSDSFSFIMPSKQKDKCKLVTEDKKHKKKSVHNCQNIQTGTKFKSELKDSFIKECASNKTVQNALSHCNMFSTKSGKSSTSLLITDDDFMQFSSPSERQATSNRKALKLELPVNQQATFQTPQLNSSPHSSCSDNKSWSQGSSVGSPTSRAQFSSPDLGIESDANHEQRFLIPHVNDTEEWESNFPSCMSVTSTRSAPVTVANDYCLWQEGSNEVNNLITGTENKAIVIQNDYSLHAIGRLEDYELLKKIMEEAHSSLKGITSTIKQLISLISTSQNKKSEYILLKEIDIQCHDIRVWLIKGCRLIGSFQRTSFIQEMQLKSIALSKENLCLQEELINTRNEITHLSKQLSDVTDKLQIARSEKQLMENTITWHLTKTCRKLQEARSNLIQKDLIEHSFRDTDFYR